MNRFTSRRRFLTLGALGIGAVVAAKLVWKPKPGLWEWSSIVFGADASILLGAPENGDLSDLFEACQIEATRLESIFTLYDANSDLRRLNRDGELSHPAPELLEILKISAEIHELTGGAFDVTVQPLWDLYHDHFLEDPKDEVGPTPAEIEAARAKVGFEHVQFDDDAIRFAKPGMSMTLNAIAQGYVTDRITELLIENGIRDALVNIGEYRAIGADLTGEPWVVGIADPNDDQQLLDVIELTDRALATSGGYGFRFDAQGGFHHLFNPRQSRFADATRSITVEHPSAAWADALATAGSVMEWDDFAPLASRIPQSRFHAYENGEQKATPPAELDD